MLKLLNSFSINRDAGGSIPMIDSIDEKIISIRQRIAKFKKDHPELYESENNERGEKDFQTIRKLKGSLLSQTQNTSL